jgi:hypothetical protein
MWIKNFYFIKQWTKFENKIKFLPEKDKYLVPRQNLKLNKCFDFDQLSFFFESILYCASSILIMKLYYILRPGGRLHTLQLH